MNAESKGEQHDHESAQRKPFLARHCQQTDTKTTTEFDDQHKTQEHFVREHQQQANSETSSIDSFSHKNSANSGRNKRKNFNPRPTTFDMEIDSSSTKMKVAGGNNLSEASTKSSPSSASTSIIHHLPSTAAAAAAAAADRGYLSTQSLDKNVVSQLSQNYPWLQMFNHYEQLVKAAGLRTNQQYHNFPQTSGNYSGEVGAPEMPEWIGKYASRNSSEAASAIRDILKAYQGKPEWDAMNHQHQDGNGVNLSTETEPPTPPTTPQTTYHSSSRSTILANGNTGASPPYHHSPEGYENPQIKEEVQNSSSPPPPQSTSEGNLNWNKDSEQISNRKDEEAEYHEELRTTQNSHDEGSNCDGCDVRQDAKDETEKPSTGHHHHQHVYQWCEDLQQIDDKTIKSECDVDDDFGDSYVDNNIYDEEDYPPRSLNDFPDSPNGDNDEDDDDDDVDDDDDDDNYSLNMFCIDEQSEAQQQNNFQVGVNNYRNAASSHTGDPDDNTNSAIAEKDSSTCSNSSSRISVKNLGGLYDENGQLNLNPLSKPRLDIGIDEKTIHPDFLQNMNKFTSYLDCLNEMCRLENLREHYHCHDYPCFGKILSKKEEVIRHVKWHRKRMESLNHGFMRFSSSDDCSATFGANCQHNRKQTHYHCFQPNCDRVYISTSDVQMHSNFHRKDSAIHKEGFQRFRANEACNADYCMFSDQKTTHFHCRRDNCRYTFKNKADMEKHKTYHIKDLKLARDGFKKFLKNEACPYKQCKFSKVCNHIHCARKNCFYVLHSSGQLLSHKRKHDRMDNEQTYCRYKMLAVKAALMGNSSATTSATVAAAAEMPAFNLSKSLIQLKELELSSLNPPARSSFDVSQPEAIFRQKDNNEAADASSPSSVMSLEFLQQMKKRHEEILNQKSHRQSEILNKTRSGPPAQVSMFPVVKRSNSPNQFNMVHDSNLHLTPSVIQQFFTSECPGLLKNKTHQENEDHLSPENAKNCLWQDHPEPHLHCILKDCEAVTPNNILDISAHIRMHGYNREIYAATNAASPNPSASSSNPMQITTIDGFFNRKRGRPPKNRFVEVYKNAQQSPQAIFTSFKLEKQTTNKENPETPPTTSMIEQQQNIESALSSQTSPAASSFTPRSISSQFVIYNQNENCSVASDGAQCSLDMQQHFHCACAPDCTFVTMERDLLSVHLERQHTAISFADTISKKFKRFDRNMGLDCGIFECKLRRTRPHLHCRQCYRQISPFDLEFHVCGESAEERRPLLSNSPSTKKIPAPSNCSPTEYTPKNEQQQETSPLGSKHIIRDYSRLPSVTFSTLNELRRKVSEMEPDGISNSAGLKRSHEDEKVLVVRAAGTYFPENTSDLCNTPSPAQQPRPTGTGGENVQSPPRITSNSAHCSMPYCKQKRRSHDHCDTCDQAFVDPVKWRAHRLKHLQSTNQPIPFHLSHFTEPEESIPTSYHKVPINYDDQPQDLSVLPNTTTTSSAAADDRVKPSKESFPTSPTATTTLPPKLNPTPPANFLNYFPQNLVSSLSIQNFHLTQLATLYQQNPYYYQHLYPFLSNTMALSQHQQQNRLTAQPYRIPGSGEDKPTDGLNCQLSASVIPALHPGSSKHFPFLNPLLMVQPPFEQPQSKPSQTTIPTIPSGGLKTSPLPSAFDTAKSQKRKLPNSNEEFSTLIDALSPSTKKQVQFATGFVAAAAVANNSSNSISQHGGSSSTSSSTRTTHDQQQHGHGQHFRIRDEQIPNGYLKFRFNEDCFFPKCGYRNHQSHFHCDRNDCHYSFCDKTRFVQHTARHERLDKLMGNDFRQYRANMSCGYENCPYYKNLGSANKSSHFHCLKCDFICSDTNKVVAHRRQHNKMEYIRMAGFRKVTNSEKCNSTFEATIPTNGNEITGTVECSYSQKQTHYHCLVCDVSVLSRAQLGSHKHKT